MQAAESLRHVEQKATVILVSDGEETCNLDPCQVGRELEAAGVDFTAHVIGFDVANPEQHKQGFVPKPHVRRAAEAVEPDEPIEPTAAADGLRI